MIKSLSPYYVNVPFVNPTTLEVCTFYNFKLYVWNGLINAIPPNASYEFTKDNVTDSNGIDKINISNLISDFINFTPVENTTTDVVDGNNQNWLQYRITYNDSTFNDIIETMPFTNGYSYGMDGENAETPTNKILLSGNEFKVNRNGFFVLPIEAEVFSADILAVDEEVNIYFEDTFIDVLLNDSLGFTPTNIVELTSDMLESVGVLSIVGSQVKFTKGTDYTTPQTFTYRITDSIGQASVATVTLNISDVPTVALAVNDSYIINNEDTIDLLVMENDFLGTEPTEIISIDTTGFTLGTISIVTGTKLNFIPNGTLGEQTITYTIEDDILNQSTATVTIKVNAVGGRYLESVTTLSTGGAPNPTVIITGIYADDLEEFTEVASFLEPFDCNRCVIEGSLMSSNPSKTVYTFNDAITC